MDPTKYALMEAGLNKLVELLVGQFDNRISGKIVNTIDESSLATNAASAKAVYDFIQAALSNHVGIKFETVIGSPIENVVTSPKSNVIYLQKDNEADTTWSMIINVEGEFVPLGTTDVDLSGYWSKEELKEMPVSKIEEIVNAAFGV